MKIKNVKKVVGDYHRAEKAGDFPRICIDRETGELFLCHLMSKYNDIMFADDAKIDLEAWVKNNTTLSLDTIRMENVKFSAEICCAYYASNIQ